MKQEFLEKSDVLGELRIFIIDLLNSQKFSQEEILAVLPSSNLIENGYVDSFTMLDVVVFLEERFDIRFSPAHFLNDHFTSMEKISDLTLRLINEKH